MHKLTHHIRSFKQAWLTMLQHPVEHLISILVLALIITICAAGLSLNNSLNVWQQQNVVYPQLTLYLENNANQADVENIERSLNQQKSLIRDYKFVGKQQALDELRQDQQMKSIASDVIESANNPLPDVLIVNTLSAESTVLNRLDLQLSQLPMVADVQMDLHYASKVQELLGFVRQISLAAQILFIVVLSLVIYNMIRLQMMLKSDAIKVSRLIGASDSYIMRPLCHYAVWQVTLATGLAALGMHEMTRNLNLMFANFSNLFGKGFVFNTLPLGEFAMMWGVLVVFTIFTVFLAVRWVFRNTYSQ
jgi:cell division transport system permease protein